MTQFGRAIKELGVELIVANSPQAKGRVERMNGMLQDRLVKELRLRGVKDMAAAKKPIKNNKRYKSGPDHSFNRTPAGTGSRNPEISNAAGHEEKTGGSHFVDFTIKSLLFTA